MSKRVTVILFATLLALAGAVLFLRSGDEAGDESGNTGVIAAAAAGGAAAAAASSRRRRKRTKERGQPNG